MTNRPTYIADEDSPGRQAFRAATAALAERPRRVKPPTRCPHCGGNAFAKT